MNLSVQWSCYLKTVVLITCTKHKHEGTHKAEYLYSKSENFMKYLECARILADRRDIYIISALHKLLPLDKEIEWYDYTLANRPIHEHYTWGKEVSEQIKVLYDVSETNFVVLADDIYSSALLPYLPYMDTPLQGNCNPDGYESLDKYIKEFLLDNKSRNDVEVKNERKN